LPADELTPFVEKLAHRIASFLRMPSLTQGGRDKEHLVLWQRASGEAHESDLSCRERGDASAVKKHWKAAPKRMKAS